MCRVFFLKGDNKEIVKLLAIRMALKSYKAGNKDGYFLATKKQYVRTLSFSEYLETLLKLNSNEVLAHLRMATKGNSLEKNIHGWKFNFMNKEWYGTHNGHVTLKYEKDIDMSDTYNFYKYLENAKSFKEVKKKIEENVFGGNGVFIAVSTDFKRLLLINVDDKSFAFEYRFKDDTKVYGISSKEDIILKSNKENERTICVEETITETKKEKVWVFEHEIKKSKKVRYPLGVIPEFDVKIKKINSNMMYLIDLEKDKIINEAKLKVKNDGFYYTSYRGKYPYW